MRTLGALLAATLATLVVSSAAAAASVTTVMTGLDNPRGLAVGPEGALYVAEAGRGGPGPCVVLRGTPQCYGPTGAASRLWHGVQERIATGLPSYPRVGPFALALRAARRARANPTTPKPASYGYCGWPPFHATE
jgi:hypothetical protein